MKKPEVENTERESKENPGKMLLQSMVHGTSGFIEHQESEGQRQLVESSLLPTDMRGEEADFEALGFVLGEVVDGDPLFRHIQLPKGWTREETNHAMWSVIKDEKGRERVSVFYKAAFYDRKAYTQLMERYAVSRVNPHVECDYGDETYEVFDRKHARVVLAPGKLASDSKKDFGNPCFDACCDWVALQPHCKRGASYNALKQWQEP